MKKFIIYLHCLLLISCGTGQNEGERIDRAIEYQSNGEHRAAMIELKNVLQANPNQGRARLLLGQVYVEMGQGESAAKELVRAEELGVSRKEVLLPLAWARFLQGESAQVLELTREISAAAAEDSAFAAESFVLQGAVALSKGDFQSAREAYRSALALASDSTEAIVGLARTELADGNFDEAEAELARALKFDADNSSAWFVRGVVGLKRTDYASAEAAFSRAAETAGAGSFEQVSARVGLANALLAQQKHEPALHTIKQLREASPQSTMPKYLRALLAYQQAEYELAQDLLQQVLRQDPEHLQSILLIGAVHFARANYEQANLHLSQFVYRVPTHIQARKILGAVRLKLDRPEDAMAVLTPAADSHGDDAELLAMIGRAAASAGDLATEVEFLKRASKANPDSTAIRAELARVYMSQGAFDQAISELQAITGEHEAEAKVLLVMANLRKQDFEQARKLADETLAASPKSPRFLMLRGGVELLAGNRDAAKGYFSTANRQQQNFVPALLALARLDLEDGRLGEASQRFDAVLTADPRNTTAMLGQAQVSERRGEPDQAVIWLQHARNADPKHLPSRMVLARYYLMVGNYKDALAAAEEAAAISAQDPNVLVLLARAQLRSGRHQDALGTYQKLREQLPREASLLVEVAGIHLGLREFGKAENLLKQALGLKGDFLPAQAAFVSLHLERGELDQALRFALEARKSHPESGFADVLVGDAYVASSQYPQAQDAYRLALKRQPRSVVVTKLAKAYERAGDHDRADAVLNEWLKDHGDDINVRMLLAFHYQGRGAVKQAEEQYLQILEQKPKNPVVLNNLAALYMGSDPGKALSYAEESYRIAPHIPAVADTLGWILLKQGAEDRAYGLLQKAAQGSADPSIQYHWATVLLERGAKEEARKVLARVLDSGRDFPELGEARQLMEAVGGSPRG